VAYESGDGVAIYLHLGNVPAAKENGREIPGHLLSTL
jgi:hypothetical protein